MNSINIETEGLKNTVGKLEEKVLNSSNIFDDVETKMKMIDGTSDTWKSNAQASVYKNYRTIADSFPTIVEQLNGYILFLNKTIDNYKRGEGTINTSIESNQKDLNVN